MKTLETIFDTQMAKFRELKVKFGKIEEEKKSFDYDGKLSELEDKRKKSLEEVNRTEIYSESVKEAARKAIENEFSEGLKSLNALYNEFGERLKQILTERRLLREDSQYKEAMQIRSSVLHAQLDVEKGEESKILAQEQVKSCESRVEQAKKELELAKKELAGSNGRLKKINESLDSYRQTLSEVKSHFCEKIKDVVLINEKIIDTVLEMMDKGIIIKEKELKKPLYEVIRSKIYSLSGIRRLGGGIMDVEDVVKLDLGNYKDNVQLKAGDQILLNCTCGNDENQITSELIITITGDTGLEIKNLSEHVEDHNDSQVDENIDDTIESTKVGGESEVGSIDNSVEVQSNNNETDNSNQGKKQNSKNKKSNKYKEREIEINETIEFLKQYINNSNQKNNLIGFLKNGLQKGTPNDEIKSILEKLAIIYVNYNKRNDCLDLIFSLDLPLECIKKFIEIAYTRSAEHGSNKTVFDLIMKSIQKLIDLKCKAHTSNRDKKDIELQILSYKCQAFGVNMAVELGISDIGKSGLILAGNCDGNAKHKRGKGRK